MTGRELVDYFLDERGIVITIGSGPFVTFDQQFRHDWGNLIDKKVAEARAEALREAEESIKVLKWKYEKSVSGVWHSTQYVDGLQDAIKVLRAAITQEETE